MKRLMIYLFLLMAVIKLDADDKFEGHEGNGALSPDRQWYIDIENVSYKEIGYLKYLVINLKKNGFKVEQGKEDVFTFSAEDEKNAIPDLLLYSRISGGARYAKIEWNKDSTIVKVSFEYSYGFTFVFSYNVKTKDVSTYKIKDKKQHTNGAGNQL